jgi:hypothetical protein
MEVGMPRAYGDPYRLGPYRDAGSRPGREFETRHHRCGQQWNDREQDLETQHDTHSLELLPDHDRPRATAALRRVRIKLQGPTQTTVLRLDRHRVKPDPALFGDLKVLLGPSCLAG